jgi:glutamine cyclotransferase
VNNGNFTIREWYEPDDAPPSTASPAPSLAPRPPPTRCREVLWESTGLYGQSQVRVVDLLTGLPIATTSLDRQWFGEGLARVGDELLQLTWQGPRGFRWRARPQPGKGGGLAPSNGGARTGLRVAPIGTFDTPLEDGWGAAVDRTDYSSSSGGGGAEAAAAGARQRQLQAPPPPERPPLVVLSDGSDRLTWVHPNNLTAVRHVQVRDPASENRPVTHLNELEVVDGKVWANVWMTDCVAVVDGSTGAVTGWALMHGLRRSLQGRRDLQGTEQMDVLNGIAWDQRRRRLFVTGKLWPRLFEVRVVPLSPSQRAEAARYLLPTCFVG